MFRRLLSCYIPASAKVAATDDEIEFVTHCLIEYRRLNHLRLQTLNKNGLSTNEVNLKNPSRETPATPTTLTQDTNYHE